MTFATELVNGGLQARGWLYLGFAVCFRYFVAGLGLFDIFFRLIPADGAIVVYVREKMEDGWQIEAIAGQIY